MVGEQAVQTVGRNAHGHGVEAPPALISLEHLRSAWIEPEARRVSYSFGERRNVAQAHIKPLPGDWMDDVSGVSDQRQPLADKRARIEQAKWNARRGPTTSMSPSCRRERFSSSA